MWTTKLTLTHILVVLRLNWLLGVQCFFGGGPAMPAIHSLGLWYIHNYHHSSDVCNVHVVVETGLQRVNVILRFKAKERAAPTTKKKWYTTWERIQSLYSLLQCRVSVCWSALAYMYHGHMERHHIQAKRKDRLFGLGVWQDNWDW